MSCTLERTKFKIKVTIELSINSIIIDLYKNNSIDYNSTAKLSPKCL